MKAPHWIQVGLGAAAMIAPHVSVAGDVVSLQFSVPSAVASAIVAGLTVLGLFTSKVGAS